MQACDETTAALGSVLDSGGCEGDSPSRGCRRALHLVADRREARRPQQPRDLLVRFVEQMPLGREVLLSHRRHVLPQLVAEREQPSGPQRAVYREQVAGGLVPEIQDITGGDNIDGRYLGQRGYAAVHQRQPPSLDLGQVASPGLREHFRRGIDTPYPRPAEPPERLLEADTRPGPKLGDLPGVRTVLAGLLHDPPAELGVAPGHATSDQPAERPMRTAELPGYDRHQLPPSGSRQPDRKSTRLNSNHPSISYAVFCLKKKNNSNSNINPVIKEVYPHPPPNQGISIDRSVVALNYFETMAIKLVLGRDFTERDN